MRRNVALAALLAVAGTIVVWLVEPNLLAGLRSPRALTWSAAAAAACAALGFGARRLGASPRLAVVVAAVAGAAVAGVVVVRPILSPRSLTEALPEATAPPPAPSAAGTPATPPRPETVRVAAAALRGLAGHSASGRVSTYRLADGAHVVRFEDVDIGGTPDPEVYLLPGRDRTGKDGGRHLGALKAERGTFHYALPKEFAGTEFTVVVWCERFAVDIAHASPR